MVPPGSNAIAFVFPGQASQRAGMAAALLQEEPVARPVFAEASEILRLDLAALCSNGTDALLTRTDIAQPALLTTSIAWLAVLRQRGLSPHLLAGHSLGEFSAWVASGALRFDTALTLVQRRGQLMAEAARLDPGGMLAVIGLAEDQVLRICKDAQSHGIVVPANHNSPDQIVVSGHFPALEKAEQLVKAKGGKAIPLRVAGAFHSPLMADAAQAFSEHLSALLSQGSIKHPEIPVVANATALPVTDADGAHRAMAQQMTSPVRWDSSVRRMLASGIRLFVEVGPGRVLTNLIARTSAAACPAAKALPVGSPAELHALLQEVAP